MRTIFLLTVAFGFGMIGGPDVASADEVVSSKAAIEKEITKEELDSLFQNIQAASNAKNIDGIRQLMWDDAKLVLISKGEKMEFNVPEYMTILKDSWGQTTNYTYEYQKEDCQVNGARTRCTGTIRETMVLSNGQFLTSAVKGEDVFEKRAGVVKIVFSKANADEATIGSRQSPNVPLEILHNEHRK